MPGSEFEPRRPLQKAPSEKMVLFLFAIRRSPSCRPSLARCRGRQTGHFLEIASLLPPPAALRRFPRPARSAFQSRGEAGFLRMASPFAGCREASSSLVARSKRHHLRRWCLFFLPFGAHRRAGWRDGGAHGPRALRVFYRQAFRPARCYQRAAKKADRVVRPTVGQRGIADKRRRGLCAPPPFLCACHITAARALARAA